VAGPLFGVEVAVTLLSCVLLALIIWVTVFVGSQRWLLVGETLSTHRQNNRWGFLNHFEENCCGQADNLKDQAQIYLLRVMALTNATEVEDGYLLNAGTNTFHVRDRYVRRLRGVKDAKSQYEVTCFFVANQGMPSAEQIATALLMLKNDPALFDKWAARHGELFKADGQIFN
jgi:hypothetical protein